MFTRVVEVQTKPGKGRELCSTLAEKALPILRNQPGFMDLLVMASNTQSDRVLAISLGGRRTMPSVTTASSIPR